MIGHYRVPAPVFDALAHGCGDPEAMSLLRSARLSKQLLQIRAVADAARSVRGAFQVAGISDAVALFDEAEQRSPAAVASVLGYPIVGAWAAHSLRRLRRRTEDDPPLWVDLSHFSAVAVAAAIRAGIDVDLPVPVRDGVAHLPSLGCARLSTSSRWGVTTVRGGGGGYRIGDDRPVVVAGPDGQSPGWEPVAWLRLAERGRTLTVAVDDQDPYRSHGFDGAARLDAGARASWRSQLARAWTILVRDHPERAAELAANPLVVIPLAERGDVPHVSGTNRDSAGAMALSPSREPFVLALAIAHELQHSKLGALLDLMPLYDRDDHRRRYSPWRVDPRPIGGLLQGAYAFLAIGRFWGRYAGRDTGRDAAVVAPGIAEYEFARSREQVRDAVRDLAGSGALTPAGQRFVAGLGEAADALAGRPMPAEAARLARLVRDDHRLGWRLRHVQVDPGTIDELAAAWRRSDPRPAGCSTPDRVVNPAEPSYPVQPLAESVRRAILGQPAAETGPAAALLAGDWLAAADLYLAALRAEPARLDLWTGLALARQRTGPPPLARTYTTEPELVMALCRRLAANGGVPADPDAVASWLAG